MSNAARERLRYKWQQAQRLQQKEKINRPNVFEQLPQEIIRLIMEDLW